MYEYFALPVVHRICQERKIDPIFLVAGLIDALAPYHRFSRNASEALRPSSSENVFDHIIGMTQNLELDASGCHCPNMPFDDSEEAIEAAQLGRPGPNDYVPASLLETLELAMADAENQWKPDVFDEHPSASGHEENPEVMSAHGQRTLRLILREAMRELERQGLAFSLEQDGKR
jgi:hypothetical protein